VSIVALEIHDAGLVAVDDSAPGVAKTVPSPGYALHEGDRLLTGSAAMARARLEPRRVHSRFWSDLDGSRAGNSFPPDVTRADLAHAHLLHVWQRLGTEADELILVVSGCYSDEQLGLMLGIAQAAGLPVSGMVDAATAAGVHGWPGTRLFHLDLQLHRAVVTDLAQGEQVTRRSVQVDNEIGWVSAQATLSRSVAELFLHETRFDPLHAAATEQQLYDSLPTWLDRLGREASLAARFESAGREHEVALTRGRLVSAVAAYRERLVQRIGALKPPGEQTTLLLSARAALLPGLAASLAEIARTRVLVLPETASCMGALISKDRIRSAGAELSFVTRLPVRAGLASSISPVEPEDGRGAEAVAPPRRPTHLLLDGEAHRISDEPLLLGLAIPADERGINIDGPASGISRSHCSVYRSGSEVFVEDHSTHGSYLNGERIAGKSPMSVGDRLRLGSPGVELQLIRVVEADGTAQG